MNGNCHFIFGAAVGSALVLNLGAVSAAIPQITNTPETATLLILGGVIGGIFPDIDNESSYMGKLSAPVSTIIGSVNKLFGKVGSNHRGILHDPIIYLVALVLSFLFFPPLIGFIIGCLSHLFLDLFNPKGIPVAVFKRVHLANFKSGSIESVVFTWVCVVLLIGIGIFTKVAL